MKYAFKVSFLSSIRSTSGLIFQSDADQSQIVTSSWQRRDRLSSYRSRFCFFWPQLNRIMIIIDNNNVACDVIRFLLAIPIDWFFLEKITKIAEKKRRRKLRKLNNIMGKKPSMIMIMIGIKILSSDSSRSFKRNIFFYDTRYNSSYVSVFRRRKIIQSD